MKLIEIEIEEFGKLEEKDIVLGKGMNLIEGPNESGKSTLLSFIRFVFYGFPRKNSAEGDEREKRLSFRNRRAAGRLLFEVGGQKYRIYRAVFLRGTAGNEQVAEELSVMALPEGKSVPLGGKTPGEYFLGLPAQLYDSSLCVRQSDIERVGQPGVGDQVSRVLSPGNTETDMKNAQRLLEDARRELLHLKGRGGKIAELEDLGGELAENLSGAREEANRLRALRENCEEIGGRIAEKKQSLADLQASIERGRLLRDLQSFADLHRLESETLENRKKLEVIAQRYGGASVFDTQFPVRARAMLADKRASEEYLRRMEADLARMTAVQYDEGAVFTAKKAETAGGKEKVCATFRRHKWLRVFFAGLMTLFVCAALGSVVWHLALPDAPSTILAVAGVAGALAMLPGLLIANGKRKKLAAELELPEEKITLAFLGDCEREAERFYASRAEITAVEYDLKEAKKQDEKQFRALQNEFMNASGKEYTTVESGEQMLQNLIRRQGEAHMAVQSTREALMRAEQQVEQLKSRLSGLNESTLKARLTALPETATESGDLAAGIAGCETLANEIAALEREHAELRREETALSVTAKDVEEMEYRGKEVKRELEAARRQYRAITMAIETLGEANEDLCRGVVPKLRGEASEIFRQLTCGAYEEMHLSGDLAVSLDAGGTQRPLSDFSAGCRDAAYLSLRLALLGSITEEPLPLLFDEALARLDDDRAKALVCYLMNHCAGGGQCLLFTCHSRESEFLGEDPAVRRISL